MDTIDKIFHLMSVNNTNAAQLTKGAGLTQGLVTQWKQRKQNPSMDSITKVASYFNVSTDYLLVDDFNIPTTKNNPSENEVHLVNLYRGGYKRAALEEGQPMSRRQELMLLLLEELDERSDEELERDLDVLRAMKKK